ncbi:hypothetical protein Dimus_001457 [Dionaea muscipula]
MKHSLQRRRVRSTEMKPFRRFVHFIVMKNIVPRFGKRDTTSFMDLTYMDHLVNRRRINLPRVMMRHMAYGEEPKKYDFFQDTFLTMCKLTGENGIWWIGSGENRRRDDDEATPEEEAKVKMKEIELILIGRRSLMRQPLRGNRGRGRSSMMPRKMLKALRNRSMRFQQMLHPARLDRRTRA